MRYRNKLWNLLSTTGMFPLAGPAIITVSILAKTGRDSTRNLTIAASIALTIALMAALTMASITEYLPPPQNHFSRYVTLGILLYTGTAAGISALSLTMRADLLIKLKLDEPDEHTDNQGRQD